MVKPTTNSTIAPPGGTAVARVLLVEDDAVTRRVMTAQLRRLRHLVLAVESVESALAAMASLGHPDVAVLDVGLPGRNGLSLLQQLRIGWSPEPPGVIVVSAGPPPPDQTGIDRYLLKPVTAHALATAVTQVHLSRSNPGLSLPTARPLVRVPAGSPEAAAAAR
jgi:CheY-like chemotaxis protein